MGEIDYEKFVAQVKRNYCEQDIKFSVRVFDDVINFLNRDGPEGLRILTFPPLDSQWRYLIHKISERFDLKSYAVGEGVRRLTMVMKPERLLAEQSAIRKKTVMENRCEGEKNSGEDSGLSTSKTLASLSAKTPRKKPQLEHVNTTEFMPLDKNISKKTEEKKKTPEKRGKKTKGLTFSLTSGVGYNLETNSTPKNLQNIIPPRLNVKASEFIPTNVVEESPRFRHIPYYPQYESCPRYKQYEDNNVYPLDSKRSQQQEICYYHSFDSKPKTSPVKQTEVKNTGAIPKFKIARKVNNDSEKKDDRKQVSGNNNEANSVQMHSEEVLSTQFNTQKSYTIDKISDHTIINIAENKDTVFEKVSLKLDSVSIKDKVTNEDNIVATHDTQTVKESSTIPVVYNTNEAGLCVPTLHTNSNIPLVQINPVPIPHYPTTGVRMGVPMNNQMNVGLPIQQLVRIDDKIQAVGVIPFYPNDISAKNYPVIDYSKPFYDDLHYSNIAYYHEEEMPMSFYDDDGQKIIHFPTDVPDAVKLKEKDYDGKKYLKFDSKATLAGENLSKKYEEFCAKVNQIEKEDLEEGRREEQSSSYDKSSNPEYDTHSDSSYSNSEFYSTPVPHLNLSKLSNGTAATTIPFSSATATIVPNTTPKFKQSTNDTVKRTCLNFSKPEQVSTSPKPLARSPSPVVRTETPNYSIDCGDPEVVVTFRPFRNQNSGHGDQKKYNSSEMGSSKDSGKKCGCDCHDRSEKQGDKGPNVPGLTLHIFWEPNYLKK